MASKVMITLLALVAFVVVCVHARNDVQFVASLGNTVNPSLTSGRWGFSILTLLQGSHTYAGYLMYNGPSRAAQITFTWINSPVQSVVRNFQITIPSTTNLRGLNAHYFTFNATLVPELTDGILRGQVKVFVGFNATLNISANYTTGDDSFIALLNETLALPPLTAGNKTGAVGFGFFSLVGYGGVAPDTRFPQAAGGTFELPRRTTQAQRYFFTGRVLDSLPNSNRARVFFPSTNSPISPFSLVPETTNFTATQRNWVTSPNGFVRINERVNQVALNSRRAFVTMDKQNVGEALRGQLLPLTRLQSAKFGVSGGKVTIGRTGNNWGSTWVRDSVAGSNVPANYLAFYPEDGRGQGTGTNARSLVSQVFFKIPTDEQSDSQLRNAWPLHSIAAIRINYNIRLISVPDESIFAAGAAFLFNLVPHNSNTPFSLFTFRGFNTTEDSEQRWFSGFIVASGSTLPDYISADRKMIMRIQYYPGTVANDTPAPVFALDELTVQLMKSDGRTIDTLRAVGLLPSVESLQPV